MRVFEEFAVGRPQRRQRGGKREGRKRERDRGHAGRTEEEMKSRVCVVCESKWPMKRN